MALNLQLKLLTKSCNDLIRGFIDIDGSTGKKEMSFHINNCTLKFLKGNELSSEELQSVFHIFRQNMQRFYSASSLKWASDEEKKTYLSSSDGFYILLFKENVLIGFTMWKIEFDDMDYPSFPVVYLYELQIDEAGQGKGYGKALFKHLMTITKGLSLKKLMLTCFKSNTCAMAFYKRCGLCVDETSPCLCGYPNEDYEILSIRYEP